MNDLCCGYKRKTGFFFYYFILRQVLNNLTHRLLIKLIIRTDCYTVDYCCNQKIGILRSGLNLNQIINWSDRKALINLYNIIGTRQNSELNTHKGFLTSSLSKPILITI